MIRLSPKQSATARNNLAALLQAVADIGGKEVAGRFGVDKSTVTRWKDEGGKLQELSKIMAALDIQAVPMETWVCPADHIPLPIPLALKTRTIVAGAVGEDSDFLKECDEGLRKLKIIRRDADGELTIPMRFLR